VVEVHVDIQLLHRASQHRGYVDVVLEPEPRGDLADPVVAVAHLVDDEALGLPDVRDVDGLHRQDQRVLVDGVVVPEVLAQGQRGGLGVGECEAQPNRRLGPPPTKRRGRPESREVRT
jgi:hypothetical protein